MLWLVAFILSVIILEYLSTVPIIGVTHLGFLNLWVLLSPNFRVSKFPCLSAVV
ncbi:hypothetical protein Mmol_0839 [Methylotenera mobilis JLW8]|uniref:Uncharacterized protein n=1 Tax=Methylotenera mobilis (strain JLW8 / ATCC BAA-1282 / DSM 17540) TaxID=583345 RepID=C6WV00_METML|nr:hypothetical protein Mmol_0839 [Methylotenera mobilis JLW8]